MDYDMYIRLLEVVPLLIISDPLIFFPVFFSSLCDSFGDFLFPHFQVLYFSSTVSNFLLISSRGLFISDTPFLFVEIQFVSFIFLPILHKFSSVFLNILCGFIIFTVSVLMSCFTNSTIRNISGPVSID